MNSPQHFPAAGTVRLMLAALFGCLSALAQPAEAPQERNADTEWLAQNGWMELHWAVAANDGEAVLRLIENGANVNAKDKNGTTPLHVAASANAQEIAKLLIDRGAGVNTKDKEGWTPLLSAAQENAQEVAKLLIEHGAEVNAKENDGNTPMDLVIFKENGGMQSILRQYGGRSGRPSPPTGTATEKWLRTKDAWGGRLDVNARVKPEGWVGNISHLHVAVWERDMVVVRWLLANGADVNARTDNDWTPIDWAIFEERRAMQSLLKEYGGECNKKC